MRQLATTLMSGLVLALVFTNTAPAQERTDVVWARFFDGQGMTIDGQIDEAVWDQAESFTVEYGTTLGLPGSGWWFGGDGSIANPALTEPTDPPTATIRLLASGDSLYIAGEVADKSIGGARGLWDIDAIFLPIRRPGAFGPSGDGFHWFNTAVPEIMLGWWNPVDTTDAGLPLPGVDPYPHTRFEPFGWGTDRRNAEGQLERIPRTEEQMRNWEIATSIDGITNDDTHGEDNGWTFEMKINLAELGYNLDDPDGEIVEFGLAVQDADYWWPTDPDRGVTARAWFEAPFANTFGGNGRGSIKLHADPAVTVTSGALPTVGPDLVVPDGSNFDAPTIDGSLDEDVWAESNAVLQIQYGNQDLMQALPKPGRYQSGYFRPGASAEVQVVDPNLATVKWFFQGNTLYVGVDVDDQAVDSTRGEGGDGFRFATSDRGAINDQFHYLPTREFIVTVDENGEARLEGYFPQLVADGKEDAFDVAILLKGSSTVADPSDVDEGYQIEMALDLTQALGYPDGLGDGVLFPSFNHFDSDKFEDETLNYSTRTWRFRERADGPGVWAVLDPAVQVATEAAAELPSRIVLAGTYPNPFNPTTTMRYTLPEAGDVRVRVFDVLGRQVAQLIPGAQAAGEQQIRFEAGGLSSGVYFYRVELTGVGGSVRVSTAGRMILVK